MSKNISVPAVAAPLPSKADLLLQLAMRCEREEPSRELDSAIARAFESRPVELFKGGAPFERLKGMYWVIGKKDTPDGTVEEKWSRLPKFYTSSLDAAVTLVPEGWTAVEVQSVAGLQYWSVTISREIDGDEEHVTGRAKTEAMARCAAALRARAAGDLT